METVTSRQSEIQKFIADGCKEALLEEKRRFCFLVDKHCSFASHIHQYHLQVRARLALSVAVALVLGRLSLQSSRASNEPVPTKHRWNEGPQSHSALIYSFIHI